MSLARQPLQRNFATPSGQRRRDTALRTLVALTPGMILDLAHASARQGRRFARQNDLMDRALFLVLGLGFLAGCSFLPAAQLAPMPAPGATATPWLVVQEQPGGNGYPTLADFWEGRAEFVVEVKDTGLPRGESETIVLGNGELWSYLHASDRSAGTVDRCGDSVEFPGCTVIYKSYDGGFTFQHDDPPICQFECAHCPCDPEKDHVVQQQYPRVFYDGETMILAYEYLGRVMLRRSTDGLNWSPPQQVSGTGVWNLWLDNCAPGGAIGEHPFVRYDYECLAGGPPGVYIQDGTVYVFLALGQSPGGMGCYYGQVNQNAGRFKPCEHNPLFVGAGGYGPLEEKGPQTNLYFDFRMISSAEVVQAGGRYYMLYEGIRGPGRGDPGDSQFGLGLARSLAGQIDGPWEKFPGNPILVRALLSENSAVVQVLGRSRSMPSRFSRSPCPPSGHKASSPADMAIGFPVSTSMISVASISSAVWSVILTYLTAILQSTPTVYQSGTHTSRSPTWTPKYWHRASRVLAS